jgi:serine/threonine protein phosphatase PrpC
MGSSHRQNQLPCQDAFCYRNLGDRLVAAVCDGAGSAAYSEQGAALVAHELADRLATFTTAPDEKQLATLIASVRETVLLQAQAGNFRRRFCLYRSGRMAGERPPQW